MCLTRRILFSHYNDLSVNNVIVVFIILSFTIIVLMFSLFCNSVSNFKTIFCIITRDSSLVRKSVEALEGLGGDAYYGLLMGF